MINNNYYNLGIENIDKILKQGYEIKIYSNYIKMIQIEKKDIHEIITFNKLNLKNEFLLNLFINSGNIINIVYNNNVIITLSNYYGETLYKCFSNNLENALNNISNWIKDNIFIKKNIKRKTMNYNKISLPL